jgi:hypothetical protein
MGNRHGLKALKRRVRTRGLDALDRRSGAARDLVVWKEELVTALGGEANITPQENALIEMIVRQRIFIDHVDGFLLSQETLVVKKKRAIIPVLRERQSLVDGFARLLGQLGMKRREKPIPTLSEYLEQRAQEEAKPAAPIVAGDAAPRGIEVGSDSGSEPEELNVDQRTNG